MLNPDWYAAGIFVFYIFLWIFGKRDIKNRFVKYVFNAVKFSLLLVFWGIFMIKAILILFPVMDNDTGKYLLIRNNGKDIISYAVSSSNDNLHYTPVYRQFYPKNKNIFQLSSGASDTFELPDYDKYYIIRYKSEEKKQDLFHKINNGNTINIPSKQISHLKPVFDMSFGINNILMMVTALTGIWYHIYHSKEDEIKLKIFLGGALLSILSTYLIYKYVEILLYWLS